MEEEDVPRVVCWDCKYWNIRLELNKCKRVDHIKIQYAKAPFASYHLGEASPICNDFEPKYPHYVNFKNWKGAEHHREASIKQNEYPDYDINKALIYFCKDSNFDIEYGVLFLDYINGTMFDEKGELKAVTKRYYKRTRKCPIGYKLIVENLKENK